MQPLEFQFGTPHRGFWIVQVYTDDLSAKINGPVIGESVTISAGSLGDVLIGVGEMMKLLSLPASLEEQILLLVPANAWKLAMGERPAELAYYVCVEDGKAVSFSDAFQSPITEAPEAPAEDILTIIDSGAQDVLDRWNACYPLDDTNPQKREVYMLIDCEEHGRHACFPCCPFCHLEPWEDWTDDLPALWPKGFPGIQDPRAVAGSQPADEEAQQDEHLISAILAGIAASDLYSWDDNGGAVM